MECILTIDQSTFSTKAFIINKQGEILASSSLKHKQHYPKSGWVEHDANEIYQNLIKVVNELKKNNQSLFKKIIGIAITNQRETTVIWDKQTGKPIANAIVWQCRRTSSICESLKEHEAYVENLTGLKIDPYFSATKIKWLLDHSPKDENEFYAFGTIESWLIYKLTNGKQHVSDVTNASRTLLMNIDTLKWDEDLCNIFDIPMYLLPRILDNDKIFGYSNMDDLFEKRIPICGVIGDSQAALFAQHCFDKGSMKVTLGTGSSLMINAGTVKPQKKKGIVLAVAWRIKDQSTYANEAIINCSCDTLNWLRDQLGLFKDESELNAIWDKIPHNDGVYLVPAFLGLSVPWWSNDALASISGLARNHNYEFILRAGLESIGYQIYDAAKTLEYDKNQILHIDGGAINNIGLMQFISDILDISVSIGDNSDLSAIGAFEIARLKLFGKDNVQIRQEIIKPKMIQEERNKNIAGWHNAIEGVLATTKKKRCKYE